MADRYADSNAGETPVEDEMSDYESNPQGETPEVDGKSTGRSQRDGSGRQVAQNQGRQSNSDSDSEEGEGDESQANVDELVFDNWLSKQPVEVQELVARQQRALRDALVEERQQRKTLSKQIGALAKKAEGNAAATKELNQVKATLEDATRKANFFMSVPTDCANPKLAFAAAQLNGYLNSKGEADWDAIRREVPELFRRVTVPSANAGAGAKQAGANTEQSMNAFIRAALGRGD